MFWWRFSIQNNHFTKAIVTIGLIWFVEPVPDITYSAAVDVIIFCDGSVADFRVADLDPLVHVIVPGEVRQGLWLHDFYSLVKRRVFTLRSTIKAGSMLIRI